MMKPNLNLRETMQRKYDLQQKMKMRKNAITRLSPKTYLRLIHWFNQIFVYCVANEIIKAYKRISNQLLF